MMIKWGLKTSFTYSLSIIVFHRKHRQNIHNFPLWRLNKDTAQLAGIEGGGGECLLDPGMLGSTPRLEGSINNRVSVKLSNPLMALTSLNDPL